MNTLNITDEFVAAHRAKDTVKIGELLSDKMQFTTLLGILGKRDYIDFAQAITEAMPDLTFQIETLSQNNGDVLVNFGLEGTHTKTFTLHAPGMKPLPPTHKKITLAPDLLHYKISGESHQITAIYPEPGHEGGVVYLLQAMGAKLPPLWIPRALNRLMRAFSN